MIAHRKNFYELTKDQQLQILIKVFTDAGYDLNRWFFEIRMREEHLTIQDLEDACKTAVEVEDYEKASLLRDIIEKKKKQTN